MGDHRCESPRTDNRHITTSAQPLNPLAIPWYPARHSHPQGESSSPAHQGTVHTCILGGPPAVAWRESIVQATSKSPRAGKMSRPAGILTPSSEQRHSPPPRRLAQVHHATKSACSSGAISLDASSPWHRHPASQGRRPRLGTRGRKRRQGAKSDYHTRTH